MAVFVSAALVVTKVAQKKIKNISQHQLEMYNSP